MPKSVEAQSGKPRQREAHDCLLYALHQPGQDSSVEANGVIRLANRLRLRICVLLVITEAPRSKRGTWLTDRIPLEPTAAEQLAKAWSAIEALRAQAGFPPETCFDVEFGCDYASCVRRRAAVHGTKIIVASDRWLRGNDQETQALLESDVTPVVLLPTVRAGRALK